MKMAEESGIIFAKPVYISLLPAHLLPLLISQDSIVSLKAVTGVH